MNDILSFSLYYFHLNFLFVFDILCYNFSLFHPFSPLQQGMSVSLMAEALLVSMVIVLMKLMTTIVCALITSLGRTVRHQVMQRNCCTCFMSISIHVLAHFILILLFLSLFSVVTVNSPPTIVTPPQNQDVPLSSLVNLTCFVTGAPQPAITWYFDGTPIMGATSPVYIIDSIEPSQRGTYSCRAQNSEGMDSASALVTINGIVNYLLLCALRGRERERWTLRQPMV